MNVILFVSSIIFYFWGEKQYVLLVFVSMLLNFFTGKILINTFSQNRRKVWLFVGVFFNLSILIFYKYFDFFSTQFLSYFMSAAPYETFVEHKRNAGNIHLPLGISFFTFHGITYITDIYRSEAKGSKNFLDVGLYTLFFPQLIAGPIVRFKDIHTQIRNRIINNEILIKGIKRFIVGLTKKVVIANSLGYVADQIYKLELIDLTPELIWFGIFIFALQLYYDFSGYSDMAIGLAAVFGFHFPENFNFPYAARSLSELWKRWHISLTTFFRHYLYIPLGGNNGKEYQVVLRLIFVFLLTGFWHGAEWNCILWGLFTGVFIVLEKYIYKKQLEKLPYFIANIYTLFLFITALLIFKIEEGKYLKEILTKAFVPGTGSTGLYNISYFLTSDIYIIIGLAVIFSYPIHQWSFIKKNRHLLQNEFLQTAIYLTLFIISIAVLSASSYNPFIYFKF